MLTMAATRVAPPRAGPSSLRRTAGIGLCAAAVLVVGTLAPISVRASAPPTQAQVNAAILKAIQYLDTQQNSDGSFGSGFPIPETAMAVIAYGVVDQGDVNSGILTAPEVTRVKSAVAWLISQQSTTADQTFGSWDSGGYPNYSTGLALSALAFSKNAAAAATLQTAIANGRTAALGLFQGPSHNPTEPCSSTPPAASASYCGGFNYDWGTGRSDQSNTGFGMTGLKFSGGVPAGVQSLDAGWQHNIQVLSTNPFFSGSGRSDGGGSYVPGETYPPFTSNANDTGSMLYGYGYDAVPASDPGVVAGLKFGQDVLDTYLKNTSTREGVYHTGAAEDGSCVIGVGGCDWQLDTDGGYHYSLWALSKGLAEYISPNLSDPANWDSKVATLLLGDQLPNGSWPVNGRDDATAIVSTGFSVFALGLAGSPPSPVTAFAARSYHPAATCSGAHLTWVNPAASNYGGVRILRRTTAYPTGPNDPQATLVANVRAPATSFNDTGLAPGSVLFYGAFAYDTTGALFGPEVRASASTVVCGDGIPVPEAGAGPGTGVPGGLSLLLIVLGAGVITVTAASRRRRARV